MDTTTNFSTPSCTNVNNSTLQKIHTPEPATHKIYYLNQFSQAYKMDERIIKTTVKNNTYCTNPEENIQNNYIPQKAIPSAI